MRVSANNDGVSVLAVSGTHVVHLGFNVTEARRKGLLGFAVRRKVNVGGEVRERWIRNMRTFPDREPGQDSWPTNEAPIQKFRWGDYTAYPKTRYVLDVYPAYGNAGAVELGAGVHVEIDTEDPDHLKHSDGTAHGVYFSRSAAASQAYVRKFGERTPDEVPDDAAFRWLSRGLLEALLAFIDSAQNGDELAICIYEFHLKDILEHVRAAVDRGVSVRVIYDSGTGESAPRGKNEAAIEKAGLENCVKPREGLRSHISHHKFMVLVRGGIPRAVWTGSTNMSLNGIYAQLNVGHRIESEEVARQFFALHQALWEDDPELKETRAFLDDRYPDLKLPAGKSCGLVFSPRTREEAMEYYLELMRGAQHLVVITTPFGVDKRIEEYLKTSSPQVIKFGLVGSADRYTDDVTRIDGLDGTFYTMPARIESVLDRWQQEQFQFQSHAYIHTKFLLVDPLSESPTLVTGSANFSKASCIYNDENMLVILGHTSATDVYFTEFLRMFEHYAFRHYVDLYGSSKEKLPLDVTDHWTDRFFRPGSERERDRLLFSGQSV